ncbi:ribosomal protection-like ABC-F family protein [Paenibacillus sp. 7541]|uniref:ribosomal protection-like ABC-F family protein n=1 Tax=Paenibacillus sp. 7541 TaxID=2026236 RepID=UPI000BA5ADBE|nr:ABC-F family ATP-binding cassette domain-containing protein [Paenibacillus sp. 7541]PAK55376.1 ABC transporter ATP-binding protein [Paenibacillus sp. 7541]
MNMITAKNLTKYHGANLVLDHLAFDIKEGERIGLIGLNGSGKSTLMRLIAGVEQPDEGQIMIRKDARIGYLAQTLADHGQRTVLEVLSAGLQQLTDWKAEMTELERSMGDAEIHAQPDALDRILKRYASLQERFQREGGYAMEASIDKIASGLSIAKSSYGQPFGSLSGGEQTRVALAAMLIVAPDILLLDEPTNHLDLERVEWLESFLKEYPGTVVLVSHDRYFLDRTVTRVMEIEDGEGFTAEGGYTAYIEAKEKRLLQQFELYQEQQKVVAKMKESIKQLEEWGRVGGNEKFFKRAASMQRALDRMQQVKRPVLERRRAEFELEQQDRSGRRAAEFAGLSMSFGGKDVLKEISGLLEYGERVVLLGANGSGKSTLFKLLLGHLEPDAGVVQLGARIEVGYLAQQEEPAEPGRTVLKYFQELAGVSEGEARGILARYLFYGPAVFRKLGNLSGGEWTRLRLAVLVQRKPNLLLLDEPTNHLDTASREALEEALQLYGGTVLAISHDRYFVNRLAGKVWELKDGQLTVYHGNYEAYRDKKLKMEQAIVGWTPSQAASSSKHQAAPVQRSVSTRDDDGMNSPERLEEEISALETQIQALDRKLEDASLDTGQHHADVSRLEAIWNERNMLQIRLDELMARWVEIS